MARRECVQRMAVAALAVALGAGGLGLAGCTPAAPSAGSQGATAGSSAATGSAAAMGSHDAEDSGSAPVQPDPGPDATSATPAGSTDEAPAQPDPGPDATSATPAEEQYDFVCDAFYISVPAGWVEQDPSAAVSTDGQTAWSASQNGNQYHFEQSAYVGVDGAGDPVYNTGALDVYVGEDTPRPSTATLYGTTSDGRPVYTDEASAGFLATAYSEGATLTIR